MLGGLCVFYLQLVTSSQRDIHWLFEYLQMNLAFTKKKKKPWMWEAQAQKRNPSYPPPLLLGFKDAK